MSDQLKAFQEALRSDPSLNKIVREVGNDPAAVVAIAKSAGFNITIAELLMVQETHTINSKKELSDSELESIAGGVDQNLGREGFFSVNGMLAYFQ